MSPFSTPNHILPDELCRPTLHRSLFSAATPQAAQLMEAMDGLNARFGRNTVFPAGMGVERSWKLRADHHSPRYTTRLEDLPRVT